MTDSTVDPVGEHLTYNVRDYIDAKQLKKDLAFSPADLSSAMIEQASLFAHYGQLAAEASHQVDVVKVLLENAEAAMSQKIRNKAVDEGEKLTEPMVTAKVAREPYVRNLKRALNKAKRVEATGKMAVESFRHRKDMLVQLGSTSREEMKGELYIRERSARDSALEANKGFALDSLNRIRQNS